MDFEQYLNRLSENLDEDLNEIVSREMNQEFITELVTPDSFQFCPYCGEKLRGKMACCPYCGEELIKENNQLGQIKPLCCLKHYENFEEATKSKIGTFEKIYNRAFLEETKRPLIDHYGYDTMDYAPLVNPLTSALEIELNASVISFLRIKYGEKCVFRGKKTVELKNRNNSLRDIQVCMEEDINRSNELYRSGMTNVKDCIKDLASIIAVRNKASHKKEISQGTFFKFYDDLFSFFEKYIDNILALKVNNNSLEDSYQSKNGCVREGIIFTDTLMLSKKIFGVSEQAGYFVDLFQGVGGYIVRMQEMGIRYHFLDIANYPDFNRNGHWQDYYYLLDSYYKRLSCDHKLSDSFGLFIVGGEDVIPMPRVLNPFLVFDNDNICARKNDDLSGCLYDYDEAVLDSDFLYSYIGADLDFLQGTCWVDVCKLRDLNPRLWVGRYPLERDNVEADIEPISQYLERVIATVHCSSEKLDGNTCVLPLKQHISVVCDSLKKSSEKILSGLPMPKLEDVRGVVFQKKFLSPEVDFKEGFADINDFFLDKLQEADMLTFLLHGSPDKDYPEYYGQNGNDLLKYTVAFKPELLQKCNVKFISGLCCWGAKFTGFDNKKSMLLTSMRGNTLIFMGSCCSARGYFDFSNGGLIVITLGEILLKEYLRNVMMGYEVGKALSLAKLSYLRHPDTDLLDVLATILEFNLYGDPFIAISPMDKIEHVSNETYLLNSKYMKREYKKVYDVDEAMGNLSLLDHIRSLVDNNLKEIRMKVSDELYANYHIGLDSLTKVYSFEEDNGKCGYRLDYKYKANNVEQSLIVDTDKKGNILHIVGSI